MLQYVNQSLWVEGQPIWISSWTHKTGFISTWGDVIDNTFQTAGKSAFEMALMDNDEEDIFMLAVKGVVLDHIGTLGADLREANEVLDGVTLDDIPVDTVRAQLMEPFELMRSVTWPPRCYHTWESWNAAHLATLRAGKERGGDAFTEEFGRFSFDDCCRIIMNRHRWLRRTGPDAHVFADFNYSMITTLSHLNGCTNWSRITVTQCGLLGRVPHGTQQGDVVALFAGAQVPFVLRPPGEPETGFKVVGPCYVHGVMQGELSHVLTEENMVPFVLG
ncbi:uncharacterized protein LTR77_008400 [Saxophila tyrrhenica]|uniref:Uncharacterized protein n=1 Tax=Saxophila tyrrhenica TaxID=1690608 RepID=A0AAV9P2S0_9PEZI|nr:hypothetical protein LTR77_008400 [Saxophila tyrrhenica]